MEKLLYIILILAVCTSYGYSQQTDTLKLTRIERTSEKPFTAWRIQNDRIYLLSTYNNAILVFTSDGKPLKPVIIDTEKKLEFHDFVLPDRFFYLIEKTSNSVLKIDTKGNIIKRKHLYSLHSVSINSSSGKILIECSSGICIFNKGLIFEFFIPIKTACPLLAKNRVPFTNYIGEGRQKLDLFMVDINENSVQKLDTFEAPEKMLIYSAKTFSARDSFLYLHLDLGYDGKLIKTALLKVNSEGKIVSTRIKEPILPFVLDLPREYIISDKNELYSFFADGDFFELRKIK